MKLIPSNFGRIRRTRAVAASPRRIAFPRHAGADSSTRMGWTIQIRSTCASVGRARGSHRRKAGLCRRYTAHTKQVLIPNFSLHGVSCSQQGRDRSRKAGHVRRVSGMQQRASQQGMGASGLPSGSPADLSAAIAGLPSRPPEGSSTTSLKEDFLGR